MAYRKHKIRDKALQKYREQNPSAHGGALSRTRYGRSRRRTVSQVSTMNLTLRSTQARGAWSFRQPKNRQAIAVLTNKFARRFGVLVLRLSNVGNHLHLHAKFPSKSTYVRFIRALTAAIVIAVTGCSRWTQTLKVKFWDLRPFTRVIHTLRQRENYERYLELNDLEGDGIIRATARWIIHMRKWASRQARYG